MKIYIRSLGIFVSSLFFLLPTLTLSAQEPALSRSTPIRAVAAEPQAAAEIVSSGAQVVPALPVPRVLKFSGVATDAASHPLQGVVGLTFAIYSDQQGGVPLWMETQNVDLDTYGRYTVLLGSTKGEGVPLDLFAAGEQRWLGVKVELPGEVELTRVVLVSVPYALKASDADTLGGKPASAYLLAPQSTSGTEATSGSAKPAETASGGTANAVKAALSGTGTANYIPLWKDSVGTLTNSALYQTSTGNIGLGVTATSARLVIAAPKGGGVLNSSNLVDQDMFVTLSAPGATDKHTYFGPSVNTALTLGVNMQEKMRITNAGRVGIGTSTPAATLDVNGTVNALSFTSTNGFGGSSPTSFGVFGDSINPAAGAAGVFGFTLDTYSTTYLSEAGIAHAGLWGDAANGGSSIGIGIFGTADSDYAAAFINNSASFPALFADNNGGTGSTISGTTGLSASGSSGDGVDGTSESGGNGVYGIAESLGAEQAGVLGVGNQTSVTYGSYNIYSGVWGDTGTSSTGVSPAWAIGVLGTADDSHAGVFLNNSSSWSTMYVSNSGSGGTGLFKTLHASTSTGTCGFGGNGDMTCTGQVKTLATTGGARKVETYAMQSAENWMEDFGSGTLQSGAAVVNIDPAFAETVSPTADYHVFITPNGDSKGLYVFRKTAGSFEVRESGGGTSSLSFDYRIVAKRRGYESQRLTDVTESFNAEQKPLERSKAEARTAHPRPARSPLVPNTHSVPKNRPLPGSQNIASKNLASATHP